MVAWVKKPDGTLSCRYCGCDGFPPGRSCWCDPEEAPAEPAEADASHGVQYTGTGKKAADLLTTDGIASRIADLSVRLRSAKHIENQTDIKRCEAELKALRILLELVDKHTPPRWLAEYEAEKRAQDAAEAKKRGAVMRSSDLGEAH